MHVIKIQVHFINWIVGNRTDKLKIIKNYIKKIVFKCPNASDSIQWHDHGSMIFLELFFNVKHIPLLDEYLPSFEIHVLHPVFISLALEICSMGSLLRVWQNAHSKCTCSWSSLICLLCIPSHTCTWRFNCRLQRASWFLGWTFPTPCLTDSLSSSLWRQWLRLKSSSLRSLAVVYHFCFWYHTQVH